jgi:hypothetical protein
LGTDLLLHRSFHELREAEIKSCCVRSRNHEDRVAFARDGLP